nr:serine hydrolase [Enterococcus sp. DIV2402]
MFIQEMNKKCKLWKMNDTVFQNASGLSRKGQLSNAQDMLRLTLQAVGSEQIVKIWGAKKYSVTIKGETPRTIKVKTTVTNPALENAYLLLGGKSGTLGAAVNNASILAQVKDGTFTFVSIVMKSSTTTSRYEDTKKLLDVILKKMENPHYIPTETFTAVSLAGVLLPNNPLFWTNLDKLPTYSYYGLNESQLLQQASLTKLMTSLIILENISNIYETFTIQSSDLVGGSGPKMYDGDQINFIDALYFMLLPSSNITAKAIGRVIGHKIIQARGYI